MPFIYGFMMDEPVPNYFDGSGDGSESAISYQLSAISYQLFLTADR
jgi:hypothetical protein